MISTGAWAGQRCFVVGGGPSLKDFDWSLLAGERWIGTNVAGMRGAPVAIACDRRFVERFGADPRWHPETVRIWQRQEDWEPPAPWRMVGVANRHEHPWPERLEDGLALGPCTGIAALSMADVLGADPILLLGFDMQDEPAGHPVPHFHDLYDRADDEARRDNRFDRTSAWVHQGRTQESFREQFERYAPHVRARVLNLSVDSALRCFPKARWSVGEGRGIVLTHVRRAGGVLWDAIR